jgi:hypothetical protein
MIARTEHRKVVALAALVAALCMLFLLALVVLIEPAATTSNRDENPAISLGRPSLRDDPYIERHDDPYIDRHAEVVARYHQASRR